MCVCVCACVCVYKGGWYIYIQQNYTSQVWRKHWKLGQLVPLNSNTPVGKDLVSLDLTIDYCEKQVEK